MSDNQFDWTHRQCPKIPTKQQEQEQSEKERKKKKCAKLFIGALAYYYITMRMVDI